MREDPSTGRFFSGGQLTERAVTRGLLMGRLEWPIEDCTCGRCGSEGCVIYPAGERKSPSDPCEPTLVCLQCSDIISEDFLRWRTMKLGLKLNSAGVFTHSWTPGWIAARDAEFAAMVPA